MKVLFVCRKHGRVAPFISEQMEALQLLGINVQCLTTEKGGFGGYVELYLNLKRAIRDMKPDIVHAHYGICGLVANLQRQVPVVATYQGSDVNENRIRPISIMAIRLSKYNLFMSKQQFEKVKRFAPIGRTALLQYGILLDLFVEQDKEKARQVMSLEPNLKYVLFSSKFTRECKDPALAKAVVAIVDKRRRDAGLSGVELLPLTGGYTKEEMVSLMNAVDAAIVTSKSEGSPQFVKEVMACGTPIVSVDVGDVSERVSNVDGCYVVPTRNPRDLADALEKAIIFGRTTGRKKIMADGLDNEHVARKLTEIYRKVSNSLF